MVEQLELDFQTSESLLPHEWDLLELLLDNRGKFIKPSFIQGKLRYFQSDGTNEHNDGGRLKIRQAIRKLRLEPNVAYLIISSPRGYKVATEKEARKYITSVKITALKKWKMYWALEEKLAQDGQMKMMFGNELKEVTAHIEGIERAKKGAKYGS